MPLRDDLLNPIAGSNPSGINLRYDSVTDRIKETRREEMEAPQGAWKTAVKVADYAQVIKLAGDALATRSKDLQIAAWLVDAQIRRDGFAALAPCFRLLTDLCTNFWETIYPEIEDGDDLELRAAPLDWLGSKLEEPIRSLPVTSNGLTWLRYKESRTVGYEDQADSGDKKRIREQAINEGKIAAEEFDAALDATPRSFYEERLLALEAGLAALEELTTLLDKQFGSFSPNFLKTRTALEDCGHLLRSTMAKKRVPAAADVQAEPIPEVSAPAAAAVVIPAAAPAAVILQAPPPAAAAAPVSGELSSQEDAIKQLAAVARYLRSKDVYDISPYLILRGFRWGQIRYNGPEIDRGMLTAPGDDARESLESRYAAGDWDGVLTVTEAVMETSAGRGWLDVQRFAVKALEKKGAYFAFVADAIRTGVRGLLQDLPELPHLRMRDGLPSADEETLGWIETEVLAGATAATQQKREAPVEPSKVMAAAPVVELTAAPPQLAVESLSQTEAQDPFEQALQAAQDGHLSTGLKLLTERTAAERSGRGRFRRRVQLAHMLVAAGKNRVARPLLEDLTQEIEKRQLEHWEEAEALAYPVRLLLRCCCADDDVEKRARLYAAICRLDPVSALQIEI